ncbi:DNA polymerase III subunit alpha [Thermasporomyces composti]|jgi:DNA polymerase-3 subunit alpha|uniref:DNA polymerase III subunit alpha n=1 Tax=Thermasporomyces composti TaxID=696763 RepID=A0A3D9UZZ8_THECX|nr:DNA polymerase III subunit alpha [Thermasporomyces composti]REF34799.1 DNA polymerase-3 subunit alpha [Thermasporomyces composti]
MADSFVHLHVHTEYSMLDGAAKLKDIFAEVQRLGMPAVAITDHGNLHGAYDFFTKAKAAGITPIIGLEAYVAPESRFHKAPVRWGQQHQKDDDVSGGGAFTHMTIWARDVKGLHNLFKLQTRASMEGFFRKPRVDRELLAEHAEGLMATTGCPSGEIPTKIRLGMEREALEAAAEFRDIFGAENFFVELMDHGIEIDKRARPGLEKIARELGLQYVVTNDSHYTYEHEATAHAALLCVQTASTLAAPAFQLEGSGYYLKSPEEMRALDDSPEWQAGCRTTLEIAERIDTTGMFEPRNLMPRFEVPEGYTEESWFREEVWRGMRRRFPNGYSEEYRRQAEYEMDIIIQMGFPSYFLVVADFIMWAKNNGIAVGPGRGSAAGSLVAYALGITDLDPIKHGLIFERFLNPERVSMPDIDIDFDERRRGEVIRYVTEKYGEDKVAQIVTFGTIKAKAAIKDAARVLGYPYALGDKITKAMPPAVMGKDIPLSGIFDENHPRYHEAAEVRALYEQDPDVRKVIDTARGLEGLIRQTGVHAAGVIMSAEPLADHIPLMKRETDGAIITQFDYPTCETLGLLKMDFLGLRNLTIIDDALRNIEASRGEKIDLLSLPLNDKRTYELLSRGDTLGVFQLDGGPMRSLLRLMKPDNFEDISAVLALYRPGPMGANSHTNYALRKNGQQPITPIHPELKEACEEILGETYGLIVYQEQVQRLAQKVAGYSLGQADLLRRAMGKKKKDVLDKEFVPFSEGMRARGYSDEAIKTLWDILVPFSDYAFNKAHTAGYGLVSYWTAYLKANYPAEYMAALLTSVQDDKDKMAVYLNECRRMGIKVLPPDVNESAANFTPVGTDIRFGLSAVRNVGANVVDAIITARETKGRFTDAVDFMAKVPASVCNKRVVESLAKAGAFDSLGHRRRALVAWHEDAVDYFADQKRQEAIGQDSLFGFGDDTDGATDAMMAPQLPDVPEWDKSTLLAHEREMLGLYVSDHPLFGIEHVLAKASDTTIGALLTDEERPDGSVVTVGGLITGVTRKMTKRGDPWAIVTLEDLEGAIDVMFFPSTYQLTSHQLTEDAVIVVKGRLDRRDEVPQLVAMEVSTPDLTDQQSGPVAISLPRERCTPPVVDRLKEIFATHPGLTQVHVHVRVDGKTEVWRLEDRWRVTPSTAFMGDLKALLGPGCVRV